MNFSSYALPFYSLHSSSQIRNSTVHLSRIPSYSHLVCICVVHEREKIKSNCRHNNMRKPLWGQLCLCTYTVHLSDKEGGHLKIFAYWERIRKKKSRRENIDRIMLFSLSAISREKKMSASASHEHTRTHAHSRQTNTWNVVYSMSKRICDRGRPQKLIRIVHGTDITCYEEAFRSVLLKDNKK